MNKFENPIQFEVVKIHKKATISFSNLREIAQGSPEVGNININEKLIEGLFGGPILMDDNYIYAPKYIKKFFNSGFKLTKINIDTLELETFGKLLDLIFLDKKIDDTVYFYLDFEKNYLKTQTV